MLFICGILVNGPYGLITTAVSADLGSHESLRGNAKALSTVTAIIDGVGSLGAACGPLFAGLVSNHFGWQAVFYVLIGSDIIALLASGQFTDLKIDEWDQSSFLDRISLLQMLTRVVMFEVGRLASQTTVL